MNAHAIPTSPQRRRELATGTVVSLLLHVAAMALLTINLRYEAPAGKPTETTVEVLLVAKEPDTPPQPSPEETKKPETAIADPPVTAVRPPPPQLEEAPIAERSRPPPQPTRGRSQARTGLDSAGPMPVPAPAAPSAPATPKAELSLGGGAGITAALPRAGSENEKKAAQDEKDFLLAQIMPFWLLNYRDPRYRDVTFTGQFMLQADGMLAPPFGKNDPWHPRVMIEGYDLLQGQRHESRRLAIESFLRAVRSAQPFRLPPGVDRRNYPHPIPVFFRLGDL